jgi:hypothetical protein
MSLPLPLAIINVLKTLAIIVIIYYALKWLGRIFAPILMKRMVHKMQQQAQQQQQYGQQRQNTTRAREGETVIDKKPSDRKQSNDSVGEYVDFEEID